MCHDSLNPAFLGGEINTRPPGWEDRRELGEFHIIPCFSTLSSSNNEAVVPQFISVWASGADFILTDRLSGASEIRTSIYTLSSTFKDKYLKTKNNILSNVKQQFQLMNLRNVSIWTIEVGYSINLVTNRWVEEEDSFQRREEPFKCSLNRLQKLNLRAFWVWQFFS